MSSGTNVFISYASDKRPLAEELTKALEKQGIEPWVAFKDLQPGQRWKDEMERAINDAQCFVILVDSNSQATPWQEAEWSAALARTWEDREKKVLPVVFGKGDTPPFLRDWVSLRIDPEREAKTWTREVCKALGNLRDEDGHVLSPRSREERQVRLTDLRNAVEELRKAQANVPPAIEPKAKSE